MSVCSAFREALDIQSADQNALNPIIVRICSQIRPAETRVCLAFLPKPNDDKSVTKIIADFIF